MDKDVVTLLDLVISPRAEYDFIEEAPIFAACFFSPPYGTIIKSRFETPQEDE